MDGDLELWSGRLWWLLYDAIGDERSAVECMLLSAGVVALLLIIFHDWVFVPRRAPMEPDAKRARPLHDEKQLHECGNDACPAASDGHETETELIGIRAVEAMLCETKRKEQYAMLGHPGLACSSEGIRLSTHASQLGVAAPSMAQTASSSSSGGSILGAVRPYVPRR